jgi:hypothetical protein
MKSSPNTVAPTALAFIALVVVAPLALLAVMLIRAVKTAAPWEFFAAIVWPNGTPAASDARGGWRDLLDALSHARLF